MVCTSLSVLSFNTYVFFENGSGWNLVCCFVLNEKFSFVAGVFWCLDHSRRWWKAKLFCFQSFHEVIERVGVVISITEAASEKQQIH